VASNENKATVPTSAHNAIQSNQSSEAKFGRGFGSSAMTDGCPSGPGTRSRARLAISKSLFCRAGPDPNRVEQIDPARSMNCLRQQDLIQKPPKPPSPTDRYSPANSHFNESCEPQRPSTLKSILEQAPLRFEVQHGKTGFSCQRIAAGTEFASLLGPVAWSAAELLPSENCELIKCCASDTCGWLFLDSTKNHSRRWCDMADCGSRAKAKRYYQRKTKGQLLSGETER
jgi:hypothetical protein